MINILWKHLKKLGFENVEDKQNYAEFEKEGNYYHNIRLSKSRLRWYLYYEIYKQDRKLSKKKLDYTQTEVFSTEEELYDIIKDIDKVYEGHE